MGVPTAARTDAIGPPQESGLLQSFIIEDPERIWLVESGKVDVFMVRAENGVPGGARSHILRVTEGQAIFGIAGGTYPAGVRLLAAPAPDTRLVELSRTQLRAVMDSGERAEGGLQLLDSWVLNVAPVAGSVPPKAYETLEPGKETALGREGRPVLPREGVVWVKHLEGQSRFLANPNLGAIDPNGYFPVSPHGWLEAQPKARLAVIDTKDFNRDDPEWEGLQNFHRVALETILANLERAEVNEASRLERKAGMDLSVLDVAFHRLASPLRADEEDLLPAGGDTDPVLLACQAVGNRLGITIRQHPDARRGVVAKDPVDNIARASGVRVRRIVLAGQWWTEDGGPLVSFLEQGNQPVALLPSSPTSYELYNPATRERIKVNPKVARTLGAFAHTFYRPFPAVKLTAADMLSFGIRGCKGDLTMIFVMGIAAGLLGMVTPIATGIIFDTVIPGAQRPQLLQLASILLAMAVCTALFGVVRSLSMLRLEGKMDASVQAAVWDRLLSLPVPFFRDYTSGDLANRGLGINAIRQTLTGSTLSSILSGVFSIFSFALLFYYSWKLALLATALIIVAFSAATASGYFQVREQRTMSKVRGHLSGLILQFITGIAKFRISGTENRAFVLWADEFAAQKQMSVKARNIANALTVFNSVFPVISSMAIFYTVAYLMENSKPDEPLMTTGEFLAFNAAFGQFLGAALQLSSSLVSVIGIIPVYERAKPILETLPEVDDAKANPSELTGDIEVKHVSFRYRPDAPLVLNDLSISISAGQFVAVVGASGCGKSTLFRLLLGFEAPESGGIYYDGQELTNLDVQSVRRQMGVVLQSGKLLSGNILQNIVGSSPLTIDDAWEAARMSGFDQDIQAMPMGMHTVISEGGGGLSGGQRQRLMIARAIVNKPRILLFDEATSALDNQTQAIVSASLEQLQATRVVIAHRLSTIVKADQIFVLDKGTLVQSGSYDELIEQPGLFAELAKRQLA